MRDLFDLMDEDHMNMTLDEYQTEAMNTAIYPGHLFTPCLVCRVRSAKSARR